MTEPSHAVFLSHAPLGIRQKDTELTMQNYNENNASEHTPLMQQYVSH